MIDRMDELDGDPELEAEEDCCIAGDDGCGSVPNRQGEVVWGTQEEEPGALMPIYGVDQSAGPINVEDANRQHRARELGLVRSPTGGWMFPK
ncbi:hypothetical protein [Sphingomonas aracearum]|uniref:Uncharacterized protein n=1 Tax=Sphingomonas aracearum TaxID=2283317 RepID=A0A369VU13_9SPHN|nr:hypothetical protein [Sphingomonas aracearum]RDE05573.1 hypothetical protein DVW87_10090 [Sphingomonas aracearum]